MGFNFILFCFWPVRDWNKMLFPLNVEESCFKSLGVLRSLAHLSAAKYVNKSHADYVVSLVKASLVKSMQI